MTAMTATEKQHPLDTFLHHTHRKHYAARTTIIHEGDIPHTLYYIVEGSVSVMLEEPDGREIVLSYLNRGDFFGEMGLFQDEPERSACVVAKTECEIAAISYAKFRQLAKADASLIFGLAAQLSSRLEKTSRKVIDLAFLDVTGRVAHTLLELAQEPDAMTHPDGMQLKVTRLEIARIVGCSREMVGRVLKDLVAEGLITAHGKTIVVLGTR